MYTSPILSTAIVHRRHFHYKIVLELNKSTNKFKKTNEQKSFILKNFLELKNRLRNLENKMNKNHQSGHLRHARRFRGVFRHL